MDGTILDSLNIQEMNSKDVFLFIALKSCQNTRFKVPILRKYRNLGSPYMERGCGGVPTSYKV